MKVITIGRIQDNDIVVNDVSVSYHHLQLVQNDNGNCSVVDLGSTNGTFVNGQRITGEVYLKPNDVVQIGSMQLPWQSYLNPKLKSKRIVWYIVTVVVMALLVVGVYFYVNYKNKKELEKLEKQEQIQTIKENELKEQYQQKLSEAVNYKKQAEDLYQQAIKTGDETYRKLADEKKRLSEQATTEANSLNNKIEQLQKQLTKAQTDKQLAEQKARDAEKAKIDAENRMRNAEIEKDNAESKRIIAENREKIASDKVKKDSIKIKELETLKDNRSKMLNNFLQMTANFNEEDYKAVCSELGYSTKNAKDVLVQKIIDTNITEIQGILNVVKKHNKEKENIKITGQT